PCSTNAVANGTILFLFETLINALFVIFLPLPAGVYGFVISLIILVKRTCSTCCIRFCNESPVSFGNTLTGSCAIIGPVSMPSSTYCIVTPYTFYTYVISLPYSFFTG